MHAILKKFTLDFLNYEVKKINKITKKINLNIRSKSKVKFDPVTDVDIKINELILDKIRSYFPKHNIKSEESTYIDNNSDYFWYVDPLDGTKNYIFGLNYYSIIIGLCYKNKPIYSLIFFPKIEKFYFSIGQKSFYYSFANKQIKNFNQLIKIKSKSSDDRKIITNSIHTFRSKKIINFFKNKKILHKITGADSMNFILLTLNRADIIIESGYKDIDILPLLNFLYANSVKYINWKKKVTLKRNNNSLIFYKENKANRKVINSFLKIV